MKTVMNLIDIFQKAAKGDEMAQLLVCALAGLTGQIVPELDKMPHGPERIKKTNDSMAEVLNGVKFIAGGINATSSFQAAFDTLSQARD